jgi:hypothetical protein
MARLDNAYHLLVDELDLLHDLTLTKSELDENLRGVNKAWRYYVQRRSDNDLEVA